MKYVYAKKNNFQLEFAIEKIITDTQDCLPYITLEFNSIYAFNQELLLNSSLYVYKKFIYKKK